jgi:hypothetical protein
MLILSGVAPRFRLDESGNTLSHRGGNILILFANGLIQSSDFFDLAGQACQLAGM